jgi:hypothetical protein
MYKKKLRTEREEECVYSTSKVICTY